MDLPLNKNDPLIMHVDLNSCFATCEQQANPLLRGKPVGIAPYTSPHGIIIAPSIEAKLLGVKVGMYIEEAKHLAPNIIILPPDPPKYRAIHLQFKKIFMDYSPNVTPKSIDEAVIDFTEVKSLHNRSLIEIGMEIKQRLREEIGEWISCNVGIATNRFWAKTAASLHKPDGLDIITHKNIECVFSKLRLIDLCGINTRFQARLNAYGIFTPLEFLNSPLQTLKKQVFQSIVGYYWYLRLRGHEIDAVNFSRKSYGQSYALGKKTADPKELSKLLIKLTEKMGRRLRAANKCANGIHVACLYSDGSFWHKSKKFSKPMYTTQELFTKALLILNKQPVWKKVSHLDVSCYKLSDANTSQLDIFDTEIARKHGLSDAMDEMNDRYGEYVITPALMLGMQDVIVDRVAFGGVKDLEDIYKL